VHVQEALERLGGIADRQSLLASCTRVQLEAALAEGRVVRLARNRYAVGSVDDARAGAARLSGAVSHLSAALAHGWKVKAVPARPSITVPRTRSRVDGTGVDLHWAGLSDAERRAGITDPVRTVVDCARTLPFDEALSVADSALRSGKVTRSALLSAAQASPRTGRAAALDVVRAADGAAANPFESVLRAVARDVPGLVVVPQGAVGTTGHADLVDAALRVAIEAESFEFHALPEAFRYDVRRYTAMTRLGWLVVRFVWEDAMHRPAYVRAVLEDVVSLRAHEQAVRAAPA
jgi:very-short-patch-repair endonuclease